MTDNSAEEAPIDVKIYSPNRLMRRRIAGSPCASCGLRMWMTEILAVQQEGFPPDFAHPACVEMNLEAEPVREGEIQPNSTPEQRITDEET